MRAIGRALGALSIITLSVSVASFAQRHPTSRLREIPSNYRDGFWLGLSVGAGKESFRFQGDAGGYSNDITAPTVTLRLGGTPSQNWLLGVELFAWMDGNINSYYDESSTVLSSAMLLAQFYPARHGSFYVKGGAGFAGSYHRQVLPGGFLVRDEESGLATVLGAGLDLRVGRNVSITPMIDLHHQFFNRNDLTERIVNLGVGVTFH